MSYLIGQFLMWTGVTLLLYIVIMRLKSKRDTVGLNTADKVAGTIVLAIGYPLDALYNVVWGTVMFLELPQEWLFTARLKRHKATNAGNWRGKLAYWFCHTLLNPHDSGHC